MGGIYFRLSVLIAVISAALAISTAAWCKSVALDIRPGPGVTGQKMLSDYFAPLKATNLDTPVFIMDSAKPGAIALVVGGTHANELAGQVAALVMVENIEITAGKLIVVPYANRSALSVRDTRNRIDGRHLIKSRSGKRFLPYGDRRTDRKDQGLADSGSYTTPSGAVLKNGKEARNLNRTYPGKSDGTATEQLAYAVLTMIKEEDVDICLDFHEARTPENRSFDTEYATNQLAYSLVSHTRGMEIAAFALLAMEEDTNISMKLEESNAAFSGLSHLEIGNATKCLSFLSESPNPGQDKWRIGPDVVKDKKYPLVHRVGIHLRLFKHIADAFADISEKPFTIKGLPQYRDLMQGDIGQFLN